MQLATLMRYVRYLTRASDAEPAPVSLPSSKACNREDFEHPSVREQIRGIFLHDLHRWGERFPSGREDRHYWRTAMTARAFSDFGVLGPRAQVLGVGAGSEPVLFWLTNRVATVFATDQYLNPAHPAGLHFGQMPVEPDRHWPGSWNPRRLVVQHMSCQRLRYPDESFDGVFAPHALAGCASEAEVEQALEEMFRVLKPGGILSLTIEFAIDGPTAGTTSGVFDEPSVHKQILGVLPWVCPGGLNLEVSAATRATEQPADVVEEDIRRHLERHGQLLWHEMTWSRTPHLAIRDGATLSVPAHLTLRKTSRRA
jgi:SAM-dependent methyltransferase